jgi:hypothetical protein
MQPDRDAQVCGIFLFVFLSTPCFEILLLLLFWRKVMLHSFLCSLIVAHIFFLSFMSIYFFSMTPQSFARLQEEKYLWTLEYLFWWMDGMFCVAPGVEVSLYM